MMLWALCPWLSSESECTSVCACNASANGMCIYIYVCVMCMYVYIYMYIYYIVYVQPMVLLQDSIGQCVRLHGVEQRVNTYPMVVDKYIDLPI